MTSRLLLVVLLLVFLAACQTPQPIPEPEPEPEPVIEVVEEEPPLPLAPDNMRPRSRALKAINFLQNGNADDARLQLLWALEDDPDHRMSRSLLDQIEADPELLMGTDFFEYKVVDGDTLSGISQAYMGDALLFYGLARYNGMENPSLLRIGQTIRIPGEERSPVVVEKPEPEEETSTESSDEVDSAEVADNTENDTETVGVAEEATGATGDAAVESDPLPELVEPVADTIGDKIEQAEGAATEAGSQLETTENPVNIDDVVAGEVDEQSDPIPEEMTEAQIAALEKQEADVRYQAVLEDLNSGNKLRAYQDLKQITESYPSHRASNDRLVSLQSELLDEPHREALKLYRQQKLDEAIDIWDLILKAEADYEPAMIYRTRAVELKKRLNKL